MSSLPQRKLSVPSGWGLSHTQIVVMQRIADTIGHRSKYTAFHKKKLRKMALRLMAPLLPLD